MPRGLGEDPLSRKRRSAPARRQSGVASLVAVGSAPSGAASQLVEFHPALEAVPEPTSYNEATFERRPDDSITEPVSESPTGAVPVPSEASGANPAADATLVAEVAPAPASPASPYVAEAAAPEMVQDAGPTAAAHVNLPQETPPEEKKVGFFSRILGKRHK